MARKASFDREEILKKAMALFWSKGFQGTSLKDLESALDLRPGSIYAAFGSKEDLFSEALNLYSAETSKQLQTTIATAPTPLAGLANHVRRLGCIVNEQNPSNACMLVKTLLELPAQDQKLRQTTEDLMRKTEATFCAAFRDARDAGHLHANADPEFLAARLQSEIFGLRSYAQRGDAAKRVPEIAENIASEIEALENDL